MYATLKTVLLSLPIAFFLLTSPMLYGVNYNSQPVEYYTVSHSCGHHHNGGHHGGHHNGHHDGHDHGGHHGSHHGH
jgi:hypothetical protein